MHEAPARIFNIPEQPETSIEFDPDESYQIAPPFESKAQWSPFIGMTAYGKVRKVILRGETVVGS
jgi:dihydroorotase-like cyclic amidohydrolase